MSGLAAWNPVLSAPTGIISRLPLLLLIVAQCVVLPSGASYIDDGSTSIQYSASTIGWDHKDPGVPNNSADPSKCYDSTYTVNHDLCHTTDGCYLRIPFTGSGITLYGIQSTNPGSFKITLDSNSSSTHSIVASSTFIYNVSFYDVQSLAYGDHTLDVALVDYVSPTDGSTSASMLRFDYAAVNDATPTVVVEPSGGNSATTITSVVYGTSSPQPTQSSGSSSIIGPVVGGVVGGLALIAVGVFLFLLRKRKPRREPSPEPVMIQNAPNVGPTPQPYSVYSQPTSPYLPPPRPTVAATANRDSYMSSGSFQGSEGYSYSPSATSATPMMAAQFAATSSGSTSPGPRASFQTTSYPSSSSGRATNTSFAVANPSPDAPNEKARVMSAMQQQDATSAATDLTEEQAKFVSNLHAHGVPAAEIARLMENMRREREAAAQGSTDAPPPSYDHAAV